MLVFIVILAYLIALLFVAIPLKKRIKNRTDFLVAGRTLKSKILVATLLATWIGSGALFGVSDLSYNHGFSSLFGSAGGWAGIIVIYFIVARIRRLRQFTVPDILEIRYNRWARLLATITTIIAYVTIVSYQFRGGGMVIQMMWGETISIQGAMLIMAAFVVVYTLVGGMYSVAYIDVFNGILMICGIFIALPFLIHRGGGISMISANATPRAHSILGNMTWIQAMGYFTPTFILALGNATMYQSFFSASDEKEAKRAVAGWIIGVVILGIALQSLAVIGSSIFKGLTTDESSRIILLVAHQGVPPVIGCLLMASIMAVLISTANSFLLVPATNIMRDIMHRFLYPKMSDRAMVLGSRISVVFLGLCAYGLVGFFPRILNAAYAAYTVYGASITPSLMAAFFWKRATSLASVLSITGGMLVTIGWEIATRVMHVRPCGLPAIYPALTVSLFLLVGISLSGRNRKDEMQHTDGNRSNHCL